MGLGKWLKQQAMAIAFATATVERSVTKDMGQTDNGDNVTQEQKKQTNSLMEALLRGEVTQEVKDLRWRTFKVMQASEDHKAAKFIGYDEDGDMIFEAAGTYTPEERKAMLTRIKLEPSDSYELEMIVDNTPITIGGANVFGIAQDATSEDFKDTHSVSPDENEDAVTIGKISASDLNSAIQTENPIQVHRELRGKFEIEKYTKKMYVRKISENEKLLEFFISKYPNEDDRKTRLLISEIKKAMVNPRVSTLLDIQEVAFISYKTLGIKDYHAFQYEITGFDKIVEFDGNYVIKFKAKAIVNGEFIHEKYKEDELEEKYRIKAPKKTK